MKLTWEKDRFAPSILRAHTTTHTYSLRRVGTGRWQLTITLRSTRYRDARIIREGYHPSSQAAKEAAAAFKPGASSRRRIQYAAAIGRRS